MKRRIVVATALALVFVALRFFLLSWLRSTAVFRWQSSWTRWNYLSHLVFILIPIAAMMLLKRSPGLYGLSLSSARRELRVGLTVAVWLFVFPCLVQGACGGLELAHRSFGFVLSTTVFAFFGGFAEELLYRGFYQGELNRVFPRTFSFGSTRFGWSLFITAFLFGVAHMLNPFDPLKGRFGLDLGWLATATVVGLALGMVRETFGGLIAVSLIHAGCNLFATLFNELVAGKIALGVAFGLACAFLGKALFEQEARVPTSARATGAEPGTSGDPRR